MNKERLFEPTSSGNPGSLRVFLSANPDADLVARLTAIVARVRQELEAELGLDVTIRWTRANQFHVTLLFLGSLQVATMTGLQNRLSGLTELRWLSPRIGLEGLGCFPAFYRPRGVWIGVARDRPFRDLQQILWRAIGQPFGIAVRDISYPHLTIARIPAAPLLPQAITEKLQTVLAAAELPRLAWRLSSVCLMRSIATPRGSDYTCLAKYPLGNG